MAQASVPCVHNRILHSLYVQVFRRGPRLSSGDQLQLDHAAPKILVDNYVVHLKRSPLGALVRLILDVLLSE